MCMYIHIYRERYTYSTIQMCTVYHIYKYIYIYIYMYIYRYAHLFICLYMCILQLSDSENRCERFFRWFASVFVHLFPQCMFNFVVFTFLLWPRRTCFNVFHIATRKRRLGDVKPYTKPTTLLSCLQLISNVFHVLHERF